MDIVDVGVSAVVEIDVGSVVDEAPADTGELVAVVFGRDA